MVAGRSGNVNWSEVVSNTGFADQFSPVLADLALYRLSPQGAGYAGSSPTRVWPTGCGASARASCRIEAAAWPRAGGRSRSLLGAGWDALPHLLRPGSDFPDVAPACRCGMLAALPSSVSMRTWPGGGVDGRPATHHVTEDQPALVLDAHPHHVICRAPRNAARPRGHVDGAGRRSHRVR